MLVDTDVLIWYMRGKEKAAAFLEQIPSPALSVVTYMELVQGMRDKRELAVLRRALKAWRAPVLPISEAVSNRAMVYVEQHFLAHSLRLADALIAATAVECGLPLATANVKHYRVIDELSVVSYAP
ncbi:MAG: type II toxin-antitoxin system VapC family toxin [Deferrisomatales bacterium]|nr:type II toxin-antitoxin system VapC family toxin [Deferrisomatales bacterium]